MGELRTASWRQSPDDGMMELFVTDGRGTYHKYRFENTEDFLSFMAQGMSLAHLQEVQKDRGVHNKKS